MVEGWLAGGRVPSLLPLAICYPSRRVPCPNSLTSLISLSIVSILKADLAVCIPSPRRPLVAHVAINDNQRRIVGHRWKLEQAKLLPILVHSACILPVSLLVPAPPNDPTRLL